MDLFGALLILLCIVVGEGVVAKAADKFGDGKQSTRYLCISVYNIVVGLAMLIVGDVSLNRYLSDAEELIFNGSKYLGIIWIVFGGVYGILAVMQKQTEIGEDAGKANDAQERSEKTVRDKKYDERNVTLSGGYNEHAIPTWKRIEMQNETKAQEECKNDVCIFCGAAVSKNQQFCGTCGRSRN